MGAPAGPRERLLEALDRLDQRGSVVDAGINTILGEAGVAKASLYEHFGSKERLIVEWLTQRQSRWFGWLEAHVEERASAEDPAAEIDAAFGFLEAWLDRDDFAGCPFIGLQLQLKDPDSAAAGRCQAHASSLHAFFLRRLQALGVSRARADDAATALLALYLGAVVVQQLEVGRRVAGNARRTALLIVATNVGDKRKRSPGPA